MMYKIEISSILKHIVIAIMLLFCFYCFIHCFYVAKTISVPAYYEVGNDTASWNIGFK